MPITIACPGCMTRYSLPDSTAGKTAKCKKCEQVFRVPAQATPASQKNDPTLIDALSGRAPLEDDLPPPAPPKTAPVSTPTAATPTRPPVRQARQGDLPPDPPRQSAKLQDEFPGHEILDDFQGPLFELPPPTRPLTTRSTTGTRDSLISKLQNAPRPALIFLGGSAALWGFLLTVVVPSMSGQGLAANPVTPETPASPAPVASEVPVAPALAAPSPVAVTQISVPSQAAPSPDIAGRPVAQTPGPPGTASLPPAMNGLYPAGTNPANLPKPTLRQDLINQHLQVLRTGLKSIDDLTSILRSVTDLNTFQQAGPRVQQVVQGQSNFPQQLATLSPLSPPEDKELARKLVSEVKTTSQAFKSEVERLQRIPALAPNAAQLSIGLAKMTASFNQMISVANQPEPGPQPFIEVFMKDVTDGDLNNMISENLAAGCDTPGGRISGWNSNSGSALRLWPVANPSAFAAKMLPTPAKYEVKGYQIYVTGFQLTADQLATYKARKAEQDRAMALANAPDPIIPAGTPPIDAAFLKIKSGKNHLVRQGAEELARVLPEETRKAEVVKLLLPMATGSDNGLARDAINALGNWRNAEAETTIEHLLKVSTDRGVIDAAIKSLLKSDSTDSLKALGQFMIETRDGFMAKDTLNGLIKKGTPEVLPYLIQYVEKTDDVFGRADAIKALGKMKSVEAAPSIAGRMKDNMFEVPDALRAIGPGAEAAVIPLLKDPDSQKRKLACEVLRDIGGQATLDVMKKLPADPDVFVKQEAANAMKAISARVKSQKQDSSPSKEKENPFGNRPAKARG